MFHHPSILNGTRRLSRRTFLAGGFLAPTAARLALAETGEDSVLSFGVVTDIHYAQLYADRERYYKGSFQKLQNAIHTFAAQDVDFAVELGDFIDSGGEKKDERGHLEEIDSVFSSFSKNRHYVLGNHDLQRFTKKEFLKYVGQPEGQYSFDVNGFHFIVLDACFNPDGSDYKKGRFDWTKSYIPESGLNWLAQDVRRAAGQPVIVFIHQILHNDRFRHCVLNAPDVRAILESHGDVRAVFQGHTHFNLHAEVGGINYLTLSAMVNGRNQERNAYAVVRLDTCGGVTVDGYNQRDYQW